jgi:hypothetical protein
VASPPVYDPDDGHWYQAVRVSGGITWPDAAAAAAISYAGYPGHLVTITSAAENQFLVSHLPLSAGDHWRVGGYRNPSNPADSAPADGWRWVTGEPWGSTNWHAGEPTKPYGGGDDVLDIRGDGTWSHTGDWVLGGGYLVEFEPRPITPSPPPRAGAAPLALFPNPVPGGLLALGQVTLVQPAGASSLLIPLASSNTAVAAVPAAVPVLPGNSVATFPIITFAVVQPTPVTITAGSGSSHAAPGEQPEQQQRAAVRWTERRSGRYLCGARERRPGGAARAGDRAGRESVRR